MKKDIGKPDRKSDIPTKTLRDILLYDKVFQRYGDYIRVSSIKDHVLINRHTILTIKSKVVCKSGWIDKIDILISTRDGGEYFLRIDARVAEILSDYSPKLSKLARSLANECAAMISE